MKKRLSLVRASNRVSKGVARRYGAVAMMSTVIFGVGVADAPVASAQKTGQPPAKRIASLKRQVQTLKRQVVKLRTQNRHLQTRLNAYSPEGIANQLAQTKAALDKYRSVDRAKADGYAPSSPCVWVTAGPREESSHTGGMGIHFMNQQLAASGEVNPKKPAILVYVPSASGLELVAAEYFKPDADQNVGTADDRPTLFGRAFDGPMMGHSPGMPIHYDLHVWLWKHNPSGMFSPWNPTVVCPSP
jgi:hypothetical protein